MARFLSFPVTQGFGPTDEPLDSGYGGYAHFNNGIDLATPEGTPIELLTGGTVIAAGDSGDGWGVSVKVRDAEGNVHNYGHLRDTTVRPGQRLAAGAVVGSSGNTGRSTGAHLSYDVANARGEYIDPAPFTQRAQQPGRRQTMATSTAGASQGSDSFMQLLQGYLLPALAEQSNGPAASRAIQLMQILGFGNYGGTTYNTLGRDQFNASRDQADRQYLVDLARFGLEPAQFNYQQRLGEAQVGLQKASLLSSLRGPNDAIGYQYALGGLKSPQAPTSMNLDGIGTGLNQPAGGTVPSAAPARQAGAEATQQGYFLDGVRQQNNPYGASPSGSWHSASPGAFEEALARSQTQPANPETQQTTAAVAAAPAPTAAPPPATAGSQDFAAALRDAGFTGDLAAAGLPAMGRGGVTSGPVVVGDDATGRNREAPEMVVPLTPGARYMVVPGIDEPGLPHKATGGVFGGPSAGISTTKYSPEQYAGQPFIDALRTGRSRVKATPALGNDAIGLDNFPSFIHLGAYNDMAPSSQGATQGLYEQGFGMDFRDVLRRSQQLAPVGYRTPAASYGG